MKKIIAIGATLILTLAMSVTALAANNSGGKANAKLARTWRAGHTTHHTLERESHGHNAVKHSMPEHDNDCTYIDNNHDGICDNSDNHNADTTTNSTHHNESYQSGRHHNSQGHGGRHHR